MKSSTVTKNVVVGSPPYDGKGVKPAPTPKAHGIAASAERRKLSTEAVRIFHGAIDEANYGVRTILTLLKEGGVAADKVAGLATAAKCLTDMVADYNNSLDYELELLEEEIEQGAKA